jgi:hypothetical protein
MTLDYETFRLRQGESFMVFIDSEEVLRVNAGNEKVDHLIQFSVESRIRADPIASYYETQDENMNLDDNMESLAEVFIRRITFKGGMIGGADECQKCPMGTFSAGYTFQCQACIPGTEPNSDKSGCTPCKKGFFNQLYSGSCRKCPPFTSSRRHPDDPPVFMIKD